MAPLNEYKEALKQPCLLPRLRAGLIGEDVQIDGPFGLRSMLYADYVASGRALVQVEDFIRDNVLPYYANSHTQASFCGAFMTRLREAARNEVARIAGAAEGASVVFAGSGSTAGINRLAALLDIAGITARGGRVVSLIGPYEHHSNVLPWRESGADVIEIAEGPGGGPDLNILEYTLQHAHDADLLVGAFSAASNVTGIVTDVDRVTQLLKQYGALAIWDYGCGAPYLEMDMREGTSAAKDAIVFSPHKFVGGPGASGVMILRDAMVRRTKPTVPGGGTVSFVSPWGHSYSPHLSDREEGGTPNVIGDIRVALCMLVKEAIGQDWLDQRQSALRARAMAVWTQNPRIEILGLYDAQALPIFSFRVRDGMGGYVHHQFFTRLLSDLYGVQARGGCACAGPYAHRLLGLDQAQSQQMQAAIDRGEELKKPGWVRLNFSALMTDEKADLIIDAVDKLALEAHNYERYYQADHSTARFLPIIPDKEYHAS